MGGERLAGLALLFACDSPGSDTGAADSATSEGDPHLFVVDGWGDGSWPEGTLRHAWADLDPQTEIFTGWEGDAGLADPDAWSSPVTMGAEDATITATSLPYGSMLAEVTLPLPSGDRHALVAPYEGAKGVVVFFHGAIYDHTLLRSNAGAALANAIGHAGYLVVAPDSAAAVASGTGGWSTVDAESNADLVAVEEIVAWLRDAQDLDANTPVLAMGMSSGGQFAHLAGAAGVADAVVAFCAPGSDDTAGVTTAPTAWFLAEADSTWPTGPESAAAYASALETGGVRAEVHVHPATPLYDERFLRVAGIDAATSRAIAEELRAAGVVDTDDRWVVSGAQAVATFPLAAFAGLTDEQVTAVGAEVEIMAAEHELYDDYAARVVAFFDSVVGE